MADTNGTGPGPRDTGEAWNAPIPVPERRPAIERVTGDSAEHLYKKDPGFQPPTDPLDEGSQFRVRKIYRDVPLVTVQNSWSVDDTRSALRRHMIGQFELSAQLVDSILGDDRVQATLGSRIGGLFGREIRFRAPKGLEDSSAYKECADAWEETAQNLLTSWQLTESFAYQIFMGFGHGQIIWDTTGKIWRPCPRPWHPRFEWFEWISRKFVAISQDGNLPIIVGDGKWYGHLPYGDYRSWVRGAVRATAEPWLIRHFAIRDWARFSEVHGLPTRVGYTPAAAEPAARAQFEQQLSRLGFETTLLVPRGVDKDIGYGYELVEAQSQSWEAFPGLRDHCDLAIILAIKFQNLTTEITSGGSYAAAKEHGKVDVAQIAADNRAWKTTIYRDFARPFAFVNFGDAQLAPITDLDVPQAPREDYGQNAVSFQQVSAAIASLAQSGWKLGSTDKARVFVGETFGLRLPDDIQIGEPPTVTTANAHMKTADASHKTADAAQTSADAAKTTAEKPEPRPKQMALPGVKADDK
jgi:phage gp29-like protein